VKRELLLLALISVCGMAGTEAWAKFGIAKTRAAYLLPQPPAFHTPGRQLSMQVTSLDPRGGAMVAPLLQQMLQPLLARERAILREQQKALRLPDEVVNEIEKQLRFKE